MGKQHRHLEGLSRTLLQDLGALRCTGPAAVVQAVVLSEAEEGEVRVVEVSINRRQRMMKQIDELSFIICFKKQKNRRTGLVEEVLGVFVCLWPYLILLIITFNTRFPVVIQTSLCADT